MTKDTGGPAFPTTDFTHAGQIIPGADGMTLRDYFAAKAMQGLISADTGFTMTTQTISKFAYAQADAMLEARAQ